MAVIGKIRKHYWFLVLVIGIALLLFVISDFSGKSRSRQEVNVGVVDGEKISVNEFLERVNRNIEVQKSNSRRDKLSADEEFQIQQGTWAQILNERLFSKQYDELGIRVTNTELNELFRGKNPHQYVLQSFVNQETGQFDKKMVDFMVENFDDDTKVDEAQRTNYKMLEKAVIDERLRTKYNSLIQKGFYVPTLIAKKAYEEANTMAIARVAGVNYNMVSDSAVKLTDEDYQKFYDENSYKFKQDKPYRSVEYVVFNPTPSPDDMKAINEKVESVYNEFATASDVVSFVNKVSDSPYDSTWKKRGDLSPALDTIVFSAATGTLLKPQIDQNAYKIVKVLDRKVANDSLRASHILISYSGTPVEGVTRTKPAAEKLADSLYNIIRSNAAAFDAFAGNYTDDQSGKQNMGDLGWFSDGAMVPEFNNAVTNNPVGSIVKVESQFGFHIIKVTGKRNPVAKVRIAQVVIPIEASTATIDETFNKANSFAANNNTYDKFVAAAKQQGLNVRPQERVSMSDGSWPGLKQARQVVQWAFSEDTKKGDVKFFDTDGGYVIATVKNVVEAGIPPLDVLKESIKFEVMRDKKAEIITKKLTDALAKEKSLSAVMTAYNLSKVDSVDISFASANIPMYGHEPSVTGNVFSAKKGTLSSPVKGLSGVYVFILDDLKAAPQTTDYTNQKRQLEAFFQNRVNSVPGVLQSAVKVEDNTTNIF